MCVAQYLVHNLSCSIFLHLGSLVGVLSLFLPRLTRLFSLFPGLVPLGKVALGLLELLSQHSQLCLVTGRACCSIVLHEWRGGEGRRGGEGGGGGREGRGRGEGRREGGGGERGERERERERGEEREGGEREREREREYMIMCYYMCTAPLQRS